MADRITVEAAKSILRVTLAKACADTVVSIEAVMQDQENPLTEIQKIELIAVAMMGYRSIAEEAEASVDGEVVMDRMRDFVNPPRYKREPEWSTEDEAREQFLSHHPAGVIVTLLDTEINP
jgi:hypothetical protein